MLFKLKNSTWGYSIHTGVRICRCREPIDSGEMTGVTEMRGNSDGSQEALVAITKPSVLPDSRIIIFTVAIMPYLFVRWRAGLVCVQCHTRKVSEITETRYRRLVS
jgi:hypothetical protein